MKKFLFLAGTLFNSFFSLQAETEQLVDHRFFEGQISEILGGCCPLFGEMGCVMSTLNQKILPGETVQWEQTIIESAHIDTTQINSEGSIVLKKGGIYNISWAVESETDSPLLLAFGIELDRQTVPQTIAAQYASPHLIQRLDATSLVYISSGQALKLINLSDVEVNLVSLGIGKRKIYSALLSIDLVSEL